MSFAVLTPTSTTPQGIDYSRGGGEMFNFFFFFFPILPVPAKGFWEWEKGEPFGEDTWKYPPVQHNPRNSAPSSPHFCARLPHWSLGFKEKVL